MVEEVFDFLLVENQFLLLQLSFHQRGSLKYFLNHAQHQTRQCMNSPPLNFPLLSQFSCLYYHQFVAPLWFPLWLRPSYLWTQVTYRLVFRNYPFYYRPLEQWDPCVLTLSTRVLAKDPFWVQRKL